MDDGLAVEVTVSCLVYTIVGKVWTHWSACSPDVWPSHSDYQVCLRTFEILYQTAWHCTSLLNTGTASAYHRPPPTSDDRYRPPP